MMVSIAWRAEASAGSSRPRCAKAGAKPAATSMTLRSRKGTSSRSARRISISRDGAARPVSMKLKWRAEISASLARSSWLRRRRCRHCRKCSPTCWVWICIMAATLTRARRCFHYLAGNGRRRMPTSHVIDFAHRRRRHCGQRNRSIRSITDVAPSSLPDPNHRRIVDRDILRSMGRQTAGARSSPASCRCRKPLVHDAGRYIYAQIDLFERQLLHGLLGWR